VKVKDVKVKDVLAESLDLFVHLNKYRQLFT